MNLTPENNMERILAGEDVAPSCRAEYFVKQAIDNAGSGGGDTYETVAEINVGQMQAREGLPGLYYYQTSLVNNLPKTDLYLNSGDILMEYVEAQGLDNWLHNFSSAGEVIETPAYAISADNDTFTIMASDDELSNTTVKILKKVSGGGSITVDDELSDTSENPVQNKVISAALAEKMDADVLPEIDAPTDNGRVLGVKAGDYELVDPNYPLILTGVEGENNVVTVSGATLQKIFDAAKDGRYVAVDIELSALGGAKARLPLLFRTYNSTDDEYAFSFGISLPIATTGYLIDIVLSNSLTGTLLSSTFSIS